MRPTPRRSPRAAPRRRAPCYLLPPRPLAATWSESERRPDPTPHPAFAPAPPARPRDPRPLGRPGQRGREAAPRARRGGGADPRRAAEDRAPRRPDDAPRHLGALVADHGPVAAELARGPHGHGAGR